MRLHFCSDLFVAGLRVAVGDGRRTRHHGPLDLPAIHESQQSVSLVVAKLAESKMPQVSVDVDHTLPRRLRIRWKLPPRIFRLSASLSVALRIRPTLAVIDMSQPNSSRSAPSACAAISSTPSSTLLPLVSRKTVGALRSALMV